MPKNTPPQQIDDSMTGVERGSGLGVDELLAELITHTAKDPYHWMKEGVQNSVMRCIDDGADIDKALNLAFKGNPFAAIDLLERGGKPTFEGLVNLARAVHNWDRLTKENPDTSRDNVMEALAGWTKLVKLLIDRYPDHPAWNSQLIMEGQFRVIGAIETAIPYARAYYLDKAGVSLQEQAGQLMGWFDVVGQYQDLLDDRLGKNGEILNPALAGELLRAVANTNPALLEDEEVIRKALFTQRWYIVDLWRELFGAVPGKLLLESFGQFCVKVGEDQMRTHLLRHNQERFMEILGQDYPVDSGKGDPLEAVLRDVENFGYPTRMDKHQTFFPQDVRAMFGTSLAKAEVHLRRRKLIAQYGDPEQDEIVGPNTEHGRLIAPKM